MGKDSTKYNKIVVCKNRFISYNVIYYAYRAYRRLRQITLQNNSEKLKGELP